MVLMDGLHTKWYAARITTYTIAFPAITTQRVHDAKDLSSGALNVWCSFIFQSSGQLTFHHNFQIVSPGFYHNVTQLFYFHFQVWSTMCFPPHLHLKTQSSSFNDRVNGILRTHTQRERHVHKHSSLHPRFGSKGLFLLVPFLSQASHSLI